MTDLPTLKSLLERVEGAGENGDNELILLAPKLIEAFGLSVSEAGRLRLLAPVGAWESFAIALAERVLPGWRWAVSKQADGSSVAYVHRADPLFRTEAPTPALALVAAILKAKIAEMEATNDDA